MVRLGLVVGAGLTIERDCDLSLFPVGFTDGWEQKTEIARVSSSHSALS